MRFGTTRPEVRPIRNRATTAARTNDPPEQFLSTRPGSEVAAQDWALTPQDHGTIAPMSGAQPGGNAGAARFDVAGTARADLDSAWRRFGGADNPEEFCQSWLELQCELIGGVRDAVVVLQKPGVETFAPLAFWPVGKRDRSHLVEICERALREGRGMLEPRASGPVSLEQTDYQLAYPVRLDGKVRGVVAME